jgi:FG-GAP-like repeat
MNYRKTFNRIILIAWGTIVVLFFMCSITSNNAQAKIIFKARVDYDTGQFPSSVAIGHLNGDGDLDLAVANRDSDNVSVLLGNPDGIFQSAVNYGIYHRPSSVAIGDLNGDGDLDLAVANRDSDNVSVLLGNGDGSFQAPVNWTAGDSPLSVAIGYLDGDANPDLAVANGGSDNVSVLLGNGDGSFQAPVNWTAGDSPGSVAIGDLDGDGDRDLAVANWASNNLSVLLGNGDGTFQNAVGYDTRDRSNSVAIGDLNGDGDLDLAVAGGGTGPAVATGLSGVSVLLGNGDGTFQNAVGYSVSYLPSSVAIGDLDGDANPDIVVTTWYGYSVSVLFGNGDGSFQSEVGYEHHPAISVAIGDLNGDGDLDLAVASWYDVVFILINAGPAYLIYTPVTPCRIVDTRLAGGAIPAGGIRSYNVWGDVASQGGNSSGCPSPKGEPYTAHINVTVVPLGNGNIVAYPFGSAAPNASLVNYRADAQNVANSGTVKTCFNCSQDIFIKSNAGTAHVIIDVLGYDFKKP